MQNGQEILKLFNEIYDKLSVKEILLKAYSLRVFIPEDSLGFQYGHIVFEDSNIMTSHLEFCQNWIIQHTEKKDSREFDYLNTLALELMVALAHLPFKDRLKVIYRDFNDNVRLCYFTDIENSDCFTEEEEDEIKALQKKMSFEDLKKERDYELIEFILNGMITFDIGLKYNIEYTGVDKSEN